MCAFVFIVFCIFAVAASFRFLLICVVLPWQVAKVLKADDVEDDLVPAMEAFLRDMEDVSLFLDAILVVTCDTEISNAYLSC